MFFPKTGMNSVYCNTTVKSQQLESHLFLMVLEAGEPKIKVTTHVATGKGSPVENYYLTVS